MRIEREHLSPEFVRRYGLFFTEPRYVHDNSLNEFIAVTHGLKPCARVQGPFRLLGQIQELAGTMGCVVHHSRFARVRNPDNPFDYAVSPLRRHPQEEVYFYVSRDEDIARRTRDIDHEVHAPMMNRFGGGLDKERCVDFGRALGYPSCCIESFQKARRDAQCDYARVAYGNTPGKPSFLTHYLDLSMPVPFALISHYPCSFSCARSVAFADRLLAIIREEEEGYARAIEENLRVPVLYFGVGKGIRLHGNVQGGEVLYERCEVLSPQKEHKLFTRGNRVTVDDRRVRVFDRDQLLGTLTKADRYNGVIIDFT
ncbi:MAG: DUF483 domain-containing protein [Candidatus Undinarchaeales archaeon]|nr:DUF483 domain-containing protein [Candidatus Undinarchaeales archaeon]MDP7492328.1 DUF483 domain-containing protein [Candidatus Undinarchaeales archaeon]